MRPTLLELTENVAKLVVRPHNMYTPTEYLDKVCNTRLIFGVNENEILDKEQSNAVVL